MVKKRNLTIQKIINAAVSLINEKGLEALTMRALAIQLDVQASAVYWHVKNKDELLQLLSMWISQKIVYPDPHLDWKAKMIGLARQSKHAMTSIRNGPEIMLRTIPSGPDRLGLIEYMLKVLTEAGFAISKALEIANLINNYTIFYAMDEFIRAEQQKDPAFHQQLQGFQASLAANYPYFHQAISLQMQDRDGESMFLSGLQAIIDGYEFHK